MPGEPMEAAQRSAEYVFQGIMYYFRREKVCPRYQFTLKDPVDPALLQQALDAALEAAPYYRVRLVWEKRKAFLEPNSEPCLVYPDSVMREMPEQTNGYFFAVHCAQNVVYFDWFHFIADGHGVSPFLTRILELYCNLRYGTAFANPPIPCSPAYDIAKLVEQYPLQVMDETTMQREVVETCEEPMHRIRIRFAKKDLVAKGVQNGVKPFCALMGLLCIALGEYLGKDTIQYSYSADTRDAMGAPNARYNCVLAVTLRENALTTLDALKTSLGIDPAEEDAQRDATLVQLINAASAWLETQLGRKLGKSTYRQKYCGTGTQMLSLEQYPIVSVERITDTFTGETITDFDFNETGEIGVLFREDGWTYRGHIGGLAYDYIAPRKYLEVQYVAGYILPKDATEDHPATLPADLEAIVWYMIAQQWAIIENDAAGLSAFSISDVSWTFDKNISETWQSVISKYQRW